VTKDCLQQSFFNSSHVLHRSPSANERSRRLGCRYGNEFVAVFSGYFLRTQSLDHLHVHDTFAADQANFFKVMNLYQSPHEMTPLREQSIQVQGAVTQTADPVINLLRYRRIRLRAGTFHC
jgi:hypothetical protein